jgi:RNA polymerase sigma-70 factor, ECF subfamily
MKMTPEQAPRFQRMVHQHLDFVWRCLRRLGVPASDADDAAQEVFLVVSGRLDDIPEEKERAFLFATAARVAANVRRSLQRRNTAYENLGHVPQEHPRDQEQLSAQKQARAVLDQVLAEMPDDLRDVFVSFEIEEMSITEIADAAEIPIGTVGSRLRRARKWFHDAVVRYRARADFRVGAAR